jgi:hypothetical protein
MLDAFSILNGLKQGDALLPLLFIFALELSSGRSKKIRKDKN